MKKLLRKKTKPDNATPATFAPKPEDKKKIILFAILVLLMLVAAFYYMMTFSPFEQPEPQAAAQTEQTVTQETSPETTATDDTATEDTSSTEQTDELAAISENIPNPDDILNADIPEQPEIAKEEIDRLKDIDSRLTEQEQLLEQQLDTISEINDKKAEQIALLEQQIAQLEAQQAQQAQ